MSDRPHQESKTLHDTSIGTLIAEGLEDFAKAIQNDKTGIPKKFTSHKVSLDIDPTNYGPDLVRQTRGLLGASQAVFAQFIGVSAQAVRAWEQGVNSPNDSAARLMDEIRHNPPYWRQRMSEIAIEKTPRKMGTP